MNETARMSDPSREKFLALLGAAVHDGTLVKASLGGYCGQDKSLRRVLVRPVRLQGRAHVSIIQRHTTRDVTKNHSPAEALALLGQWLQVDFRAAHLVTRDQTVEWKRQEGRRGRLSVSPGPTTTQVGQGHDREKRRFITPEGSPWLRALGVAGADGKIARGMEAKFRQINRYVELLQHLLADTGIPAGARLRLADMGCGKGYLTFAAHQWLRRNGWPDAEVMGLEERAELVEQSNRIARDHGLAGLTFCSGEIANADLSAVDVLVALHACDTATDDAIAKGVQAGASLIVVAPCCHKEVRPQLRPAPVLAGALRHGILRAREAEFVTDALRAALLEWAGYDPRVFEFISAEHTSKNLMIAALKRIKGGDRPGAERRVKELAGFYGVTRQRLAETLGVTLA
jgi:SAM-dependent methyltransferase